LFFPFTTVPTQTERLEIHYFRSAIAFVYVIQHFGFNYHSSSSSDNAFYLKMMHVI